MNVFLTGPKNVGKSTVINMVLPSISGLFGGFKTIPLYEGDSKIGFELVDISTGNRGTIAKFTNESEIKIVEETFDTLGVEAIENALRDMDIVVMDELGSFELGALKFREAVFKALESNKIVLGVIQDTRNEFLDAVRAFEGVEFIRVTKVNRERVAFEILEKIRGKK